MYAYVKFCTGVGPTLSVLFVWAEDLNVEQMSLFGTIVRDYFEMKVT